MTGCSADANQGQYGISVGEESIVTHCTARGNTSTLTFSAGINAFQNSSVIGCSVSENSSTAGILTGSTGVGISVAGGSAVRDCQVRQNVGDGIRVSGSDCMVTGNLVSGNGVPTGDAAGIHLLFLNCRVEGNTVTGNDRGIDVDQAENFIARNTARDNTTNYDISANNSVGTIVQSPNSAAISGLSGGAGVGSTDPWANFSF
jgi:parallel beta-helix repeat protein